MCVKLLYVRLLYVKFVGVKLLLLYVWGRRREEKEPGIQNRKQEPHTKLRGTTTTHILLRAMRFFVHRLSGFARSINTLLHAGQNSSSLKDEQKTDCCWRTHTHQTKNKKPQAAQWKLTRPAQLEKKWLVHYQKNKLQMEEPLTGLLSCFFPSVRPISL